MPPEILPYGATIRNGCYERNRKHGTTTVALQCEYKCIPYVDKVWLLRKRNTLNSEIDRKCLETPGRNIHLFLNIFNLIYMYLGF